MTKILFTFFILLLSSHYLYAELPPLPLSQDSNANAPQPSVKSSHSIDDTQNNQSVPRQPSEKVESVPAVPRINVDTAPPPNTQNNSTNNDATQNASQTGVMDSVITADKPATGMAGAVGTTTLPTVPASTTAQPSTAGTPASLPSAAQHDKKEEEVFKIENYDDKKDNLREKLEKVQSKAVTDDVSLEEERIIKAAPVLKNKDNLSVPNISSISDEPQRGKTPQSGSAPVVPAQNPIEAQVPSEPKPVGPIANPAQNGVTDPEIVPAVANPSPPLPNAQIPTMKAPANPPIPPNASPSTLLNAPPVLQQQNTPSSVIVNSNTDQSPDKGPADVSASSTISSSKSGATTAQGPKVSPSSKNGQGTPEVESAKSKTAAKSTDDFDPETARFINGEVVYLLLSEDEVYLGRVSDRVQYAIISGHDYIKVFLEQMEYVLEYVKPHAYDTRFFVEHYNNFRQTRNNTSIFNNYALDDLKYQIASYAIYDDVELLSSIISQYPEFMSYKLFEDGNMLSVAINSGSINSVKALLRAGTKRDSAAIPSDMTANVYKRINEVLVTTQGK